VLTLGYLLLGPRASELVHRDVRDVDDEGKLLWIGKTKTAKGRRRLLVPEELRVLLLELAKGRPSDAPLFVSVASRRWPAGRRWTRHMAYNHVRRICVAAGVPMLSPQAMRRTQATLATDAGATGLMVAEHLGHESPAITHRAYIEPSAAKDAQVERAVRVIAGARRDRFRGNNRGNTSGPRAGDDA
jgi:integrase